MKEIIRRVLKEDIGPDCEKQFKKDLPVFIKNNIRRFKDVVNLMLEPKKEEFKGDKEKYEEILRLIGKDDREIENLMNMRFVYNQQGEWSRINKLNTNYSDLAVFIYDVLKDENADFCELEKELQNKDPRLINGLVRRMTEKSDLYFDKYLLPNEEKYTANNIKNSKKGDKNEEYVSEFLTQSKIGWELIYQAVEGSPIDTKLGIDLVFKNMFGKVKTVQVKSVSSIKRVNQTPCEKQGKFEYKKKSGGYFVYSRYGVKINDKDVDYVAYISNDGKILICKKFSPVTVVGTKCVDEPVNIFPANPRGSFYVDHESVLLKNFFQ